MNRVLTSLLLLLSSMWMAADNHRHVDSHDLDYGTNLETPSVPERQAVPIRAHISNIRDALNRLSFVSELRRDDEVATIIIPCSELFAPNSTDLEPAAKSRLSNFSKMLRYPTMYKIVVAVFSDDTGEDAYCDELTTARAIAIEEMFELIASENGLHDINVVAYGLGKLDPLVDNNSVDNRAKNRRVEISIIPEWEMIETARAGKLK